MDMDGMDMGGSGSTSSPGMMIPYLHFTGGDNLFFRPWTPSSSGAIAGACIGLVVLALLDRWLHAVRGVFADHWQQRALTLSAERDRVVLDHLTASVDNTRDSTTASEKNEIDVQSRNTQTVSSIPARSYPSLRRTIAPFIAAYDIPRGIMYSLQMLLMYALMLAVMTFNAAYIISIIVGLGLGEILFGRVAHLSHGH